MNIFPAIDLCNKKVVRLTQGNYDMMDIYSEHPKKVATKFYNDGARHLHVVDLDGAKEGELVNFDAIKNICSVNGLFIEVGGGIRNEQTIEKYIGIGVSRVILGTIAVKDLNFVKKVTKQFKDKIAVSVDATNGLVAINGWKEVSNLSSYDFCIELRDIGIKNIIYTDISKDGKLSGTNLEIYKKLVSIEGIKITASGGISYIEEIAKLKKIGVDSVIVGKAIYEGVLNLKNIIKFEKEC
ncbi:MAG: 1-(5-phosphoribosyl)-5-[(5-phosphoribosylamino)methylideneamino]imidazole-4-carboxamide isomerase [Oscillospiraceae bacterium]|nr:1-(5-phosphoribosyl)-5-[(5-phosphoribosylamino)methylideneamino]imidazole-4-carboxamide isomerase [Oscillospiraceae bacterium]